MTVCGLAMKAVVEYGVDFSMSDGLHVYAFLVGRQLVHGVLSYR